jgi:hypothetical protein
MSQNNEKNVKSSKGKVKATVTGSIDTNSCCPYYHHSTQTTLGTQTGYVYETSSYGKSLP